MIKTHQNIPDEIALTTIIYANRNVTIYSSANNPSRHPNSWVFWHDPLIVFDASIDIYQFHEQIKFQFSITSNEFEEVAREIIISKVHPDVERYALLWTIESLPIHTLIIYVIDEMFVPIASVYPCTKVGISGSGKFECQFQCQSEIIVRSIKEKILCGKLKFQFEYYVKSTTNPIDIPIRIATTANLQILRSNYISTKYIHRQHKQQFIKYYFRKLRLIEESIEEKDLDEYFHLAINTTTRYFIDYSNIIWLFNEIDLIINYKLFYRTIRQPNQILFHLRKSDTPFALRSTHRQTFRVDQIKQMIFEQLGISVEWSHFNNRWLIKRMNVHLLSDILDYLQLCLIKKQYSIDKLKATYHRTIDCSHWSMTCVCQSTLPAIVFLSSNQFVRIANMKINVLSTGFTIELWLRPDLLPKGNTALQIIDFRNEYLVTHQSNGEIRFEVVHPREKHIYTTTLRALPLNEWTHLAFVYSERESQLKLYVNATSVSYVTLTSRPYLSRNDIIFGKGFLGAISDIRLWKCERNSNEIYQSMKTMALLGNESCLIGLWSMTSGHGQIIKNSALNGEKHYATLGFDDNPNLFTNPIWVHVVINASTSPSKKASTNRFFRENLTTPIITRWGTIFDVPVPGDYDGDGFADFAIYRRTTLTWIISSSNDSNVLLTKLWGLPGDIPVQGNFDGDKYFDYTIYRPSTSQWISYLSSNPFFHYTHKWGLSGDIPCPGDYDGDGKTDFVVYRKGSFYINPSSDPTVQLTKRFGELGDVPISNCDFDSDGVSDFTVWTPMTGVWSWIPSKSPWLVYQQQWGFHYDVPICGDFDGDKRSDFAVYRNWTGQWFIIPYNVSSFLITFHWGSPNDIPINGDYDGDGRDDFALWRPSSNGTYVWEIIPSRTPNTILRKKWGIEGDHPVIGDFDGDRKCDFTLWRPSTGFWFVLLNSKPVIQEMKHWGFTMNDTAVSGNWDGDSFTDFTIYRPSTGYWYIVLSKNPLSQIIMQWGNPKYNDIPVPEDFDGDNKTDFIVWRPTNGIWYILLSSDPSHIVTIQWGLPGDIPTSGADFDGDGKTDLTVWRPSTGSWYISPSSNPNYPHFDPTVIRQPKLSLPELQSTVHISNSNISQK